MNRAELAEKAAQAMRVADGNHTMGAGALAEVVVDALLPQVTTDGPLTPERLAEIDARLATATPGPWIAEFSAEQGNCVVPHDAQSTREAVCVTRLYHQGADAEFIAHAPQDIAYLRAEVDRLRAQVADAWDEGWTVGALTDGYRSGKPNPYRAALASGDEVQP